MRVTFDTNTMDRVVRPDLFPQHAGLDDMRKVHAALAGGKIQGVFCVTQIFVEGISRKDRAAVFESTRLTSERSPPTIADDGTLVVKQTLLVEQPGRQPLAIPAAARINAALSFGLLMLSAPRIGLPVLDDLSLFLPDDDLGARLDRYHAAAERIEARGMGFAALKTFATQLLRRDGLSAPWYQGLTLTRDIHEQGAVARAFAEWADGDTVAAHVGYGMDLLCTEDKGASAGGPSVFAMSERPWLKSALGVECVTIAELAGRL